MASGSRGPEAGTRSGEEELIRRRIINSRRWVLCSPVAAWAVVAAAVWLVTGASRAAPRQPAARPLLPPAPSLEGLVEPPVIRVGVVREVGTRVSIRAPAGVRVLARGLAHAPPRWRVLSRATFAPETTETGRVRLLETGETLRVATAAPGGTGEALAVDRHLYRGLLEVRPAEDGRLTVVNVVNLEDYLRGVVPNELSPWIFPRIEALKAQAVAARSWALSHRGDYSAEGYDVCATSACQAYRGRASEKPLTNRAVEQTRGVVATWDGRPIRAYYTSTCGGHTESGEAMLADRAPYLKGVPCPAGCAGRHRHGTTKMPPNLGDALRRIAGPPRVICLDTDATGERAAAYAARHDRWERRLVPGAVARRVARYGEVGEVRDLVPQERGVSGRVVELEVKGTEGDLELRGLRVRRGLGLRENPFAIGRERGDQGSVERFVLSGRGWGHGVGLCQVGAFGMAQDGSSFEDILRHYYTGIRITSAADVG